MLNIMRRHAYSWGVRIVLGLITVVFAFWGMGTGLFNTVHPIASLDGQKILPDQVDHEADMLKRNLQSMYGANAAQVLKATNLREQALNQVIESMLVQREARRLGLTIDNAELQHAITTNRAFQADGHFDVQTYEDVLRANNLEPAQYESGTRTAMLEDTLRQMIEQSVQLSEQEARREFDRRNEKISLAYLEFLYSRFEADIHPTEQQIADYYKTNQEEFREPERVKVVFIHYDPLVLAARITPSDKEIEDYYKANLKSGFTHPEQVHARHILISVPAGATQKEKDTAKARAEDVLKQARAGRDFAKLAEQYSDDPGNKFKGGDLGLFGRGQMVKPFEDAAFSMKPGEPALVETSFGYHIVRVDEHKPAHTDTLAEAKPAITDALKSKAGIHIARDAAREDLASALSGADLQKLGAARGLQTTESPFFAEADTVEGAERSPGFARNVFKMDKGDVRALTGPSADPFIVKLVDRRASFIPPLKDIRGKVSDAFVRARAEEAAHNAATAALKKIKTSDDFAKVAAAEKLDVHQTPVFDRSTRAVPTLGDFPEVTDAAAGIPVVPGVIDHTMESGGNSYLFEVLTRNPPTEEEWAKGKKEFMEEMLQARRAQTWTAFVDQLKQKATITVDATQLGEAPAESSM